MARKKKASITKSSPETQHTETTSNEQSTSPQEVKQKSMQRKVLFVVLALILVGLYVYFKTNIVNVAMVDGTPITRLEVEKEMNSKYAEQTIDTLVSEKIILSQAQKKGVSVSQKEIDERIKEIEKRLEGQMSLDEALKGQGLTKDSFKKQIEIQLTIDKMFAKEATVSNQEVDEYLTQNAETMGETADTPTLRNDIKEMLKQQKISELFDKWFTEIREKVNVVKL